VDTKIQNKKYVIAAEAGMMRMWDSHRSLNKTRREISQAVINMNWKTDYRSFENRVQRAIVSTIGVNCSRTG
jgi:hypothetical protein